MKSYAMMILGCKVNDYEATYVRENMNKHFVEVSFKEKADIYVIFTCCVTNTAEAKTRKFIHDARRKNNDAYIVTVGCLSQIKSDNDVFNDVDLVVGSDKKDQIVDLILTNTKQNVVSKEISKNFEELYINSYPTKSRAFLKIQDGCNQFCSYCIIPYSRGRERCGNHNSLINEAKILACSCKEIVLTGIHTGRYNDGEYNLYNLLCDLIKIDELKTIRLSSIEVTEISDEIIELMKNNDKIAHHLHIPVQSTSDVVLKNMHRPYTIKEYKDRISYIRTQIPDISISTDLIVGFPSEDDEQFKLVLKELEEIKFSFIHVFPYSRKSGTVADKMDNHIDQSVKKDRVRQVMELQKSITLSFKESFIGKKVSVLIERCDDEYSYGYCKQYIYLKLKGKYNVGDIIETTILAENIYETK